MKNVDVVPAPVAKRHDNSIINVEVVTTPIARSNNLTTRASGHMNVYYDMPMSVLMVDDKIWC